jgi:hypothetical protein
MKITEIIENIIKEESFKLKNESIDSDQNFPFKEENGIISPDWDYLLSLDKEKQKEYRDFINSKIKSKLKYGIPKETKQSIDIIIRQPSDERRFINLYNSKPEDIWDETTKKRYLQYKERERKRNL